jgi:hypothetical protein
MVRTNGAVLSVPWILSSDPKPCHDDLALDNGTVRPICQNFALDDAIEFHAFALLEANMRLVNGIPLGCQLPLTLPPTIGSKPRDLPRQPWVLSLN